MASEVLPPCPGPPHDRPTPCVTATVAATEPRRLRKKSYRKGPCSGLRHSVGLELRRDHARSNHQVSCADYTRSWRLSTLRKTFARLAARQITSADALRSIASESPSPPPIRCLQSSP